MKTTPSSCPKLPSRSAITSSLRWPLRKRTSGTVFYAPPDSPLQVAPISWEQEARYKLPVKVWRDMMDSYYPNTVWINLHKDVFDRLYRYKMQHGLLNWEQAIEHILAEEIEVNS